jgi:hypothetical protein
MLNRRGRWLGRQSPAAPGAEVGPHDESRTVDHVLGESTHRRERHHPGTGSWMEEPGAFERAGLVGEYAMPIDDNPASALGNPFVSLQSSTSRSTIGAIVIRAIGAFTILTLASGLPFGFGKGIIVAAAALLGGGVAAVRYGGDRGRGVVSTVCLVGFGLFVASALVVGAVFALFALVYVLNGGHKLF